MVKYKFFHNGHLNVPIVSGIYAIVNTLNNKKYIGSSSDIRKRYRQHYNELFKNKHVNIHLQRAFNKYGEDYFEFWILETCENKKDTLILIEQKWIDSDGSYNICKLASHQCGDVYTGHVISKKQRQIISEANRKRIWTKESRKKLSESIKKSNSVLKQRKPVVQFDLNNNLVNTFVSIADAARYLGNENKRVQIKRCCQGKIKTAYNFKWKFKNDYKTNINKDCDC